MAPPSTTMSGARIDGGFSAPSSPSSNPASPSRRSPSRRGTESARCSSSSSSADPIHFSSSAPPPPRQRTRLNSKDIPRTYSGLYGSGGPDTTDPVTGNVAPDLLPFELSRNRNTDWIDTGAPFLLVTYLSILVAGEVIACALVPFRISWTVLNVSHGLVTYVYLHWIKGSPNFYEQGEMNAMTFWEQLSSSPVKSRENPRRALMVIPTVLCHLACHFAKYERRVCALNLGVWAWCVVAKLDCMSGVRIWGINSTTGIDDDASRKGR